MTEPHEFPESLCPYCGSDKLLLGKYDGRCTACKKAFKTKNTNALECGECDMEAGLCGCMTAAGQITRLSEGFIVRAINRADELAEKTEKMLEKKP